MLNKFALVVLILQLARAERHAAAQSGPRGPAVKSASTGCATGCKTCSPSDQTCTECTESSHNIQVDGKSCKADCPANSAANSQKVCVCSAEYRPVTGENRCEKGTSTNRSALSTGAIAGISVAAVAVVGGLVGFLCWWFLCRGKA